MCMCIYKYIHIYINESASYALDLQLVAYIYINEYAYYAFDLLLVALVILYFLLQSQNSLISTKQAMPNAVLKGTLASHSWRNAKSEAGGTRPKRSVFQLYRARGPLRPLELTTSSCFFLFHLVLRIVFL